jgi:NADH dehydrogenase [ubiquinone] 1 alpha subcomplex assembly factor 5
MNLARPLRQSVRSFSHMVFNRDLKRKHREFALKLNDGNYYDYLRQESAINIIDRLEDITRSFPLALELGSFRGELGKHIASRENIKGEGGIGGITELIQCDIVEEDLIGYSLVGGKEVREEPGISGVNLSTLSFDEEDGLPFDGNTFDVVLSSLSLHWVNDLPLALQQIKSVLKPDGAFVASMFGGNTLKELRYCFYLAEQERRGGLSPHASPLAKVPFRLCVFVLRVYDRSVLRH